MRKTGDSARQRLSYMYGLGAEAHELARCLSDSKRRLVAAGAKADNLPVGIERQIHFLAALPPKAEAVVRDWFRTHSVFAGDDDAAAAVERIQSSRTGEIDADAAKQLWRAILRAHVNQEPIPAVEAFLAGAEASANAAMHPEAVAADSPSIEITDEDADICIAIAEGKERSWPSRPLPALISGIVASVRGEDHLAKELQGELAENPHPLAQKLGRTISAFEARRLEQPGRRAARKARPFIAGQVDSVDQAPFIGIVKKVLPSGQIFVSMAALLVDGEWAEVSPAQAKELFPSSGDATAFPNLVARHFAEGEIGIWTAELRSPDKSTQYVITSHQSRVYSVADVPHSSQEPDEVRQWLIDAYKPHAGIVPVFHLSDGIALRFPGDLSDPNRFNFDMPLDSYRGLYPVELTASRMVLVTQLPAGIAKFDCAPAGTLIKRLLKQRKESDGFPVLTKPHLQSLADFANSSGSDAGHLSYARALESLKDLAATKEFLNGAVLQILELPEIKARIDAEIGGIVGAYADEQKSLKAEIAGLVQQKRSIEADLEIKKESAQAEVERLKRSVRQQEAELEKRIRHTFEKASEAGLETLAKASLLKAILVGKAAAPAASGSQEAGGPPRAQRDTQLPAVLPPEGGKKLTSKRELLIGIENRAAASGLSETMLLSAVAAACAGPVMGVTGASARAAVAALAGVLADGVLCEVSVNGDMFSISDLMNAPALVRAGGHAWPATLGAFLEGQRGAGRPSVVELRGVNRAPPETLLPELAEQQADESSAGEICWKDSTGALRHTSLSIPTIFALTFVAGKSVFPLQGPLGAALPVLHTDGQWGDEGAADSAAALASTSIASEAWQSLAKEARAMERGPGEPQRRLRAAAAVLGFADAKAEAISALAFGVGRAPATGLRSEVARLAPELAAYAQELAEGSAARMLGRIFYDETGEIDE